jgi:hypothetical protein
VYIRVGDDIGIIVQVPRSIERIGIDKSTDEKYEQIPETAGRYDPV